MWIIKILRYLFLAIDSVVYWAATKVYELFMLISETGLFTPELIRTFASRIYVLLGVFMLFKVSFSLITYILNPDTFDDKSQGVGNLLLNFFKVLIGIIAVPYVFQFAYGLQTIILKDNIIGNIVMGMNSNLVSGDYNYVEHGGKLMSYSVISGFITLNENLVGEECASEPIVGKIGEDGKQEATLSEACSSNESAMAVLQSEHNPNLFNDVTKITVEEGLKKAYTESDYTFYVNMIGLTANDENGNEQFIFNYNFILSTIAGGFLAWILLIFCIDIATRSVKLGFLQLIAPIPIISYVDPKSGKEGIFKKWLNQCTKTYLDLFVRLLAIYFAIFVISSLLTDGAYNIVNPGQKVNFFVNIFIIFGALMFAKQLPELITDITGIKLGGFTLNPMKKLGESKYASALIGATGGFIGGIVANGWAAKQNEIGIKKGIKSSISGGFTAAFRGGYAGLKSDGKSSALASATKGITDMSLSRNLKIKGYGTKDKIMDRATDIAGIKYKTGTSSELKSQINELKQELSNFQRNEHALSDALNQRISEQGNKIAGLLKTFDGKVASHDEKGNVTAYETKTFESYAESAARDVATNMGENWDNMTTIRKEMYINQAISDDKIVDRDTFNSFNELYVARNNADLESRKTEKQINDLEEDMDKFRNRNK